MRSILITAPILIARTAFATSAAAQQLPLPKSRGCPPGFRESGAYCVAGEDTWWQYRVRRTKAAASAGLGTGPSLAQSGSTMTAGVAILRKIEGNTARSCNRAGAHCAKPLGVPPP